MSRASNAGGWLKGTTVRKGGATATNPHSTRPNTPQVQSTSTTIFGGGVKDASGRTSEYFVSPMHTFCLFRFPETGATAVYGRSMSCMQIRPISQPKVAIARERVLSQDVLVPHTFCSPNSTPTEHPGVNRASIGCSRSDLPHVRYVRRSFESLLLPRKRSRTSRSKRKSRYGGV